MMEAVMMEIVENWAWLECRVVTSKARDGFVEVEVVLEKSAPHESYPNLIQKTKDLGTVSIRIKGRDPATDMPERFRIKARRSAPNVIWGDAATLEGVK
jgi:hypothetical protein